MEKREKRKDAQLAREVTVALPHELTLEQNRALLREYVQEHFVKRGMAAQIDIHAPDKEGDKRNIHAHILLTTRQLTREGFKDTKARNWNEKATLKEWREGWADHLNRALEREKKTDRVDHRSHEARQIDRQPTKHLGPEASQMERRGRKSRIGDENRQAEHWNREQYAREQEEKTIDAAIAHEKGRMKTERSETCARGRDDLTLLDQQRAFETWAEGHRRDAEEAITKTYRRKDTETALKAAQAALRKAEGSRLARATGKAAREREKVQGLELTLQDIDRRAAEVRSKADSAIRTRQEILTKRHDRQREAYENRHNPDRTPANENRNAGRDHAGRQTDRTEGKERRAEPDRQREPDREPQRERSRSHGRNREP